MKKPNKTYIQFIACKHNRSYCMLQYFNSLPLYDSFCFTSLRLKGFWKSYCLVIIAITQPSGLEIVSLGKSVVCCYRYNTWYIHSYVDKSPITELLRLALPRPSDPQTGLSDSGLGRGGMFSKMYHRESCNGFVSQSCEWNLPQEAKFFWCER